MKEKYLKQAIDWVSKKPISDLKSIHEDHEDPKAFIRKGSEEKVQADLSFYMNGGCKYYSDISLKTENPQKLVTKWKLLSLMASLKRGKLFLLAPKGHKMFTQNLVKKYAINAIVYSL